MTATMVRAVDPGRAWRISPLRLCVALPFAVAGVAVVVNHEQYRVAEAVLARPLLASVLGDAIHIPGSHLIWYTNNSLPGYRGLILTMDCSSALVVGPMFVMGAAMALIGRFSPVRAGAAALVGATCLVVANLGRIVLIGVATSHWGDDAFEVTHRVVGSGLILGAATMAFVLVYRLASRQR